MPNDQPLTAAILALLVAVPDLGSELHPLNIFITLLYYTVSDDVIKWKIFRVTGPLRGESIGHRWIPLTGASGAELWRFLWPAPQQTVKQTMETPVIWDVIALIMTPLWLLLWNWNWSLLLVSNHCLLMAPNILSYSSTVTQTMACDLRPQAIDWTNGDLRLLASIPILFFKS